MFNNSSMAPSLADIAAVTGNNGGSMGNNGWWVLIILFALFGGWGRGGAYGDGGYGAYGLSTDTAMLERKLDGVNNGLCDGFYAQNTNLLNGFSNVNMAVMQAQNGIQAGINTLSAQMQQCCCENKTQINDLKYTMAEHAQAIMMNDNNNYRQLHDEMVASQLAAKDETIAQLRAEANRRDIFDSNARQTNIVLEAMNRQNCNCCNQRTCGC